MSSLGQLIGKILNTVFTTYLVSNGYPQIGSSIGGIALESIVANIQVNKNTSICNKMHSLIENSIIDTLKYYDKAEFDSNVIDAIGDIFSKNNVLEYLVIDDAEEEISTKLTRILNELDVPLREIYFDDITEKIITRIYDEILNDSELTNLDTNINIHTMKCMMQEFLNNLPVKDNSNTGGNHLLRNQKEDFVKRWNENLFLNQENSNKIRLKDIFILPTFSTINDKNENINDIDLYIENFLNQDKVNTLIIFGNPGLGKSTIMCYWAEKFFAYENYIFVRFNELDSQIAQKSIFKALLVFLECSESLLKNTVVFLDGYDELRIYEDQYALFTNFISELSSIPNIKIIISSRINYIDLNKTEFERDFRKVYSIVISPLKKEKMLDYVQKYNHLAKVTDNKVYNQLKNLKTNQEVYGIPFILYLICSLSIELSGIRGIFDIYDKVFAFNSGLYDKIYENSKHFLTTNPQIKQELLNISMEFAFAMYERKSNSLIDYKSIVRELYPNRANDFAIGNYYTIENNRLMFMHKTFYEYFLTRFIIERIYLILTNFNENDEIFKELFKLFKNNYIFLRLYSFLRDAKVHFSKIIEYEKETHKYKKCCQYIINNIIKLPFDGQSVADDYIQMNNFLSSFWRLSKLILGVRWISNTLDSNSLKTILKVKEYIKLDIYYADLSDMDISGVFLRNSLRFSAFEGANMCRSDLSTSTIRSCNFNGTQMKRVYSNNTKFKACLFHFTDFENSDLYNSRWHESEFYQTKFVGANLKDSIFYFSKLDQVDFRNSDLCNVDFSTSKLINPVFCVSELFNTVFSKVQVEYLENLIPNFNNELVIKKNGRKDTILISYKYNLKYN